MDQLTKTIQLVHSKSGHYKTVVYSSEILYNVVTRVNYLTVLLWIEYANSIIIDYNKTSEKKIETFKKPNWLIMIKSYRRDFINKLLTKH